ncbi:hypothetical protein F4680DRAFT_195356 [Xylaria scruposa]|nr:hypothetical protein F4680DRAFT_195356 [Xylaria scruposa]
MGWDGDNPVRLGLFPYCFEMDTPIRCVSPLLPFRFRFFFFFFFFLNFNSPTGFQHVLDTTTTYHSTPSCRISTARSIIIAHLTGTVLGSVALCNAD